MFKLLADEVESEIAKRGLRVEFNRSRGREVRHRTPWGEPALFWSHDDEFCAVIESRIRTPVRGSLEATVLDVAEELLDRPNLFRK
jgi:hypothetical protein